MHGFARVYFKNQKKNLKMQVKKKSSQHRFDQEESSLKTSSIWHLQVISWKAKKGDSEAALIRAIFKN